MKPHLTDEQVRALIPEGAGQQEIGFTGFDHPTERTQEHYFYSRMELADVLPPGCSLTGTLRVINTLLCEKDKLREQFKQDVPQPYHYEGVVISWVMSGIILTSEGAGNRRDLPMLIRCVNGRLWALGRPTFLLPPYMSAQVAKFDRVCKGLFS